MEQPRTYRDELVHLSRLATTGSRDDVDLYVRRIARRIGKEDPELAKQLQQAVGPPGRGKVIRKAALAAVPVDADSRLELVRVDRPADVQMPIWESPTRQRLQQIVIERSRMDDLAEANLLPTKSMLLTGPPGVGKTLSAQWLAATLGWTLLTLDLSAVMSSFLGKTGNNLRNVLDYAKGTHCVLLLDEFDAIAKRRDDSIEVGELKRLVTVLLQEIESWPGSGLLIAATNHADLLDPAVWRRFDLVLELGLPDEQAIRAAISRFLDGADVSPAMRDMLAGVFKGMSYSDIERELMRARRDAVISRTPVEERLSEIVGRRTHAMTQQSRLQLALRLVEEGKSQREACRRTGVARDTIRRHVAEGGQWLPTISSGTVKD